MKNVNQSSKAPKLRFQGFCDDWVKKSLRDVAGSPMYGMNAAAKKYDGENIYLRITDIDENTRTLKRGGLTSPSALLEEIYKLQEDDLLFVRTGASVGKSYLYKKSDGNIFFAGFLIKFGIKKADAYFVYLLTFMQNYLKWVESVSMRSGQPGINAKEYESFKFNLPTLQEQQKIADFLSSVDTCIENFREQKELLEKYKKGIMQKIFSQEIRFKDAGGKDFPEWEEKKLGDIAFFLKGKGISKEDVIVNGQNKCILYGELYTKYDEIIVNIESHTDVFLQNSIVSEKNDLLVPSSGETALDIAKVCCIKVSDVIVGGDLTVIRAVNQNGEYLAYYLSNFQNKKIAKLAQGNSVVHLYASHLKSLNITLPSYQEQQKIADFLTSIDNLIGQKEKCLQQAEEWKKGLMQQMFV